VTRQPTDMPTFFSFQQGNESHVENTTPLLGRFRAIPTATTSSTFRGKLFSSVNYGYGTLFRTRSTSSNGTDTDTYGDGSGEWDAEEEGYGGRIWRNIRDVWIEPRQHAVRRVVEVWYGRWTVLFIVPAAVVVAWCAIPMPTYPLPDDDRDPGGGVSPPQMLVQTLVNGAIGTAGHTTPGHGEARVQVNFYFFLLLYYGFYNVVALLWITKLFNIYSLNWWPSFLGFPLTTTLLLLTSLLAPIPVYYSPTLQKLLEHNTVWILWTFGTMAMPLAIAFGTLLRGERHLGLRQSLSETQRIFTSSWWTSEVSSSDTVARRQERRHNRPAIHPGAFDPDAPLSVADFGSSGARTDVVNVRESVRRRALWIPASFVRFIWFCLALLIGLLAYVLGETYAEIYLRTLPHSNSETIVYVYSWVLTIYCLDGLTGWILGSGEGERVGSYPLAWVFKLYFALTYQTYVRALYARLRRPQTFIILQLLSSSSLLLLLPLSLSAPYHSLLSLLGLNGQSYAEYRKYMGRGIFLRQVAENVSMLAFLGEICVLHWGGNRDVYPYFAFDDEDDSTGELVYNFGFTFWASSVTWACELGAAWAVRRIVGWKGGGTGWGLGYDVTKEGVADLVRWPELVPTGVAVMVHVLQNMVFGIVRLRFR
jgi:hypothetical protein